MKLSKTPMLLLLMTVLVLLASCGASDVCAQHSDTNADFICDICNIEIEKPECERCMDENKDGKCDICQKDVPCAQCADTDGDGFCDVCDKETVKAEAFLKLIDDGKLNFSFVLANDLSSPVIQEVDSLIKRLTTFGYEVNKLTDSNDNISGEGHTEVLIGTNIQSRGEAYQFDGKTLGPEGYTVKILNNNIIVSGGSDDAIIDAIKYFAENALGITDSTKELKNASFKSENVTVIKQTNFYITSIKIGDRLINDYVIVYDPESTDNLKLAKKIQETLYIRAGYWLEIVKPDEAVNDKYISILTQEKTGGPGFEIKTNESNLIISSEFPNKTLEAGTSYLTAELINKTGDVSLTDFTKNVRDINYEMFGAYGDGGKAHDDFEAIKQTHEYANKYGHSIVVSENKHYYIGPASTYVTVKTNVDWSDARFTIDDSEIAWTDTARGMPIFIVENDKPSVTLEATSNEVIQKINESGGIKAEEFTRINLGLGYPALLVIVNDNHKNYIVYGPNANSGTSQSEIVIVDAAGNVSPETPLLFDYTEITAIKVYPTDSAPITVNGGIFTTIANQAPTEASRIYAYHRGIRVTRANTTVQNLTHYVTGEGEEGMPYDSFTEAKNTYNVLFYNCTYTARKTYYKKGTTTGMGSYDISAGYASHVTWKNCNQTNFFGPDGTTPWEESNLWGIMGSSYCKNLTYDNCLLSRFDAHAGVYNVVIKDSTLQMFRIVGGGELIFDNVHMYSNTLVQLREDYGAFWHGRVTAKDVTMHNSGAVNLFTGTWYNHDFGYETVHPTEIEIDGLRLAVRADVNIFSDDFVSRTNEILKDKTGGYVNGVYTENADNRNKTKPTKKITVKNNSSGYNFIFPNKTEYPFFESTEYFME